jgi:hypothetical protein
MQIPKEIIKSGKNGKCILFLGAMASAPSPKGSPFQYKNAPPSGTELSRRLAARCEYPDEDKTNLQRVSLYYQFREGGSRQSLVKAIREEITGFEEVTESGEKKKFPFVPSPALHMLAALPFSIVITTNYNHLFDIALARANTRDGKPKQPIVRIYDPELTASPEVVPLDPLEENPILLKLHGDIDKPESIVVTEEDYIRFIQKMAVAHYHPIHENIRARMNWWPILFIGYGLKDYNLRLLFRTLRWHVDVANFPLSFSVDPYPDNLVVWVWGRGEKPMVSFIKEDLWDFVPALYKECMGTKYHEK